MYQNIHIKNFKLFEYLKVNDLVRINLIVGKNDIGKTALLEALYLTHNPNNIHSFNKLRENRNFNLSIPSNLRFFFNNKEKPIELKFKYENKDYEISYSYENEKIKFDKKIQLDSALTNMLFIPEYTSMNIFRLNELLKYYIENDSIYELEKLLKQTISEELERVSITNDMVYLSTKKKGVPLKNWGLGTNKLFNYLINIPQVKNGVLLIDEIDTGFHYSVLDKLWEVILKKSSDYNIQLFATTHRDECIESLFNAIEKLELEHCMKLFRLEKYKGRIITVSYDFEHAKYGLENGFRIRG